jgi:hypothetical protein
MVLFASSRFGTRWLFLLIVLLVLRKIKHGCSSCKLYVCCMNGLLELEGKVKSYYIVYVNFLRATVVILV